MSTAFMYIVPVTRRSLELTAVVRFWQSDEKELWSTYVEDFNTSTLPHRKYYNLEFYEQERTAKARRTGKPLVRLPFCPFIRRIPQVS